MGIARYLSKLASGLSSEGVLSAAKGGTGSTTGGSGNSSPTISSIVYPGNDTAVNTAGGDTVILNGSNFNTGVNIIVNNTPASVVTRISSTQLTFTAPAQATGNYIIYVVNTDGTTGLAVPGLQYSPVPVWTTPAGTLGSPPKSISFFTTLVSTGDGTITYSLASGTLPSGITLNSSTGVLSGTTPDVSVSTTYNFTVRSTDAQNQDTDRAFSLTVVPSNPPPTIDFLVIAGGGPGGTGGSGGGSGAGGGAGGYRTSVGTSGGGAAAEPSLSVQGGTVYTITVGAGGTATGSSSFVTSNGSNSTISGQGITTLTSLGGGFGGGKNDNGGYGYGGSGGGGTYSPSGSGLGTAGQGYNGGNANSAAGGYAAAGGGGAGGPGNAVTGSGTKWNGGSGGSSITSAISGTSTAYAGGGGGGTFEAATGYGGSGGGGGAGAGGSGALGNNASANTGSGGGGSGYYNGGQDASGSGGSGVVIIRYSNTYSTATETTGSPTYTNTGGYHIYKWTSSGSITL